MNKKDLKIAEDNLNKQVFGSQFNFQIPVIDKDTRHPADSKEKKAANFKDYDQA